MLLTPLADMPLFRCHYPLFRLTPLPPPPCYAYAIISLRHYFHAAAMMP
jgi:hypothetical protein